MKAGLNNGLKNERAGNTGLVLFLRIDILLWEPVHNDIGKFHHRRTSSSFITLPTPGGNTSSWLYCQNRGVSALSLKYRPDGFINQCISRICMECIDSDL